MRVTFIYPCVGKRPNEPYVKTWLMEPLSMAVLSALTPDDVDRVFYDDRLDDIPYDAPTDLVALSVETYTARRTYQIASRFRQRGVPVVMGGFHPTLVPDEAEQHADAIVIGQAEGVWLRVLEDARNGCLQTRYGPVDTPPLAGLLPDRSIYQAERYLNIRLVETARGCKYACEFCSIAPFYRRQYAARPVEDIIQELRSFEGKNIFFTDDNICVDVERSRRLFKALIPLKIRWGCQVSMDIVEDESLLALMRASGCVCVLIGFESMSPETLAAMGKGVNNRDLDRVGRMLRRNGIGVYATFVFGYDHDSEQSFEQAFAFALRHKFFFTAFNHIVPFPGTGLYSRLVVEKRMHQERWWLDDSYRFGQVPYQPRGLSPERLEDLCYTYRTRFYRASSVIRRATNVRANCRTPVVALAYFLMNRLSLKDIQRRQQMRLGAPDED